MKDLLIKYKTLIFYLLFGGATTIINIAAYTLCTRYFRISTVPATTIAWIVAVAVAYITNKIWVFESKTWDYHGLVREIGSFVVCRLVTGVMDIAIMFTTVDLLHWNDIVMKVISNVMVIVLNYIFSKWIIFVNKEK